MNIMFWVTEKCNLNCDYCYVKKQPKTMSMETAVVAFEYFKRMLSERDLRTGEIHVGFHGGEPLLNFPVIQFLTDMFNKEFGNKVKYLSLTTNGTIFEEEMFQYLVNNIQISVSIDGEQETNDLKRHYSDGRSSYDEIVRTLEYLKRQDTLCRIRMTINQQTMERFADNFIYLDKLGYGIVTYALNTSDKWNDADMKNYKAQLEKIMEYFIKENPEEGKYFLYNLTNANFRKRKSCDGGTTNFHVSPEGDLYPCIMAVDDPDFKLGDIIHGIDLELLGKLDKINEKTIIGCGECEFKDCCANQVCKIINKKATGDFYKAPCISCKEKEVLYSVYKKYEYFLEGLNA